MTNAKRVLERIARHYKDPHTVSFSAKGYDYHTFSEAVEGDFCQVYMGQRSKENVSEAICLKIPKDKEDNPLILNEAQVLRALNNDALPVPTYLDTLTLEDGRCANVLRKIERSYDLYAVRERFPQGLPLEHGVWVLDRCLGILGALHSRQIIHGSIEPGNILITPHNHDGFLIDFLFSIPHAHLASLRYLGRNDYSAPEVNKEAQPHPAADMYALGRTMVYLLCMENSLISGEGELQMTKFLQGFLIPDPKGRVHDAWKALHELRELRTRIFGAQHQFLELHLQEG